MPPTLPARKTPRVKTSTISHVCRGPGHLLVTLLDGKLLSLDPELGTVNWSLDLGSPLLSSSGIWYENSHGSEEPVSHSILPGADGSLYIFSDALGASQALEVGAFAYQVSSCKSVLCELQPGDQVITTLIQTWTPCARNAICPLNDHDCQIDIVMSVETASDCTAAG